MVSLNISQLMTLVLILTSSFAEATPSQNSDLFDEPKNESEVIENIEQQFDNKSVNLTIPKDETQKEEVAYFYPYRQSMSPRFGLVLDPDEIRNGDLPLLLGITYMLPRHHSPQWEVGFNIVTENGAHLSFGRRVIFNERQFFRPYYKTSLMLNAEAEEKFATITDIDNYYLIGSVGFEDVIKLPMSVRIELEFAIGLEKQFVLLNLGYSWGW